MLNIMFVDPLQAVPERIVRWWSVFWGELYFRMKETLEDRVREEDIRFQVEVTGLLEDDPQLPDALSRNGAGIRAYLAQHQLPVQSTDYFLQRPKLLEEVRAFLPRFEMTELKVAQTARIPWEKWKDLDYPHDLSQVLAGDARLFDVVEHCDQADPQLLQVTAGELARQVKAAHAERARHSKQLQAQMQ